MNKLEKNKRISATYAATKQRRKTQICKTYTAKVDMSKLKPAQKETLENKKRELKYVWNYILGEGLDPFKLNYKDLYHIYHLDKDKNKIDYDVHYATSSELEGLIDDMKYALSALKALKSKGNKVGALKFKTSYDSLFYKQYGVSYKFASMHKLKIQGIKLPIRVRGFERIFKDYPNVEITSCHLTFDNADWWAHVTVYINKEDIENRKKAIELKKKYVDYKKEEIIGLDLGCRNTINLSNGYKERIIVKETDRLKRLQAKLKRAVKGSNNYAKLQIEIDKEYRYMTNLKNDKAKKVVNFLYTHYDKIILQDDPVIEWARRDTYVDKEGNLKTKSGKSKTVHHSILGRIKALAKQHEEFVFLDNWFPTSKLCTKCGHKWSDMTEADTVFKCPHCGCTEDRDIHAANNMIWFYQKYKDASGTDELLKTPVSFKDFCESLLRSQEALSL